MNETERFAWLQLAFTPYIGAESFLILLQYFGSAQAALDAPAEKTSFAIHIRFSHFAPLISLPRTLFARSQTLYKPSADADPCPRTLFPCSQTLYTAIQV